MRVCAQLSYAQSSTFYPCNDNGPVIRYTFSADKEISPEFGAIGGLGEKRTFLADFQYFVSFDFPENDGGTLGTSTIVTLPLATVEYWLPPIKWIVSRANLAVLAAKAFPDQTQPTQDKLGCDSIIESKLPYILDLPPEEVHNISLCDQRDYKNTVICTSEKSLRIRTASYVEVAQAHCNVELENDLLGLNGTVLFVFGKGGFI